MAVVRTLAGVLALVVVPLGSAATPLSHGFLLIYVGMVPTLVACLHGSRAGLVTAAATAVLVAAVVGLNAHPLGAALLMAVVGGAIGLGSLRGWHTIAAVAASWPAVLLISAPPELPGPAGTAGTDGSVVIAALLAGAGGLWAIAIFAVVLPPLPRARFEPFDRTSAIVYATGLAVLLGVCTFVAARWWHGTNAGWVLLTILVVARPAYSETRDRLFRRSAGSVAGGVAAALLGVLVPVQVVLTVVGAAALAAAIVLQLEHADYLVYSLSLTAAIVLLSAGSRDVLSIDLQRVGFTIAGAAATAAALTVVQLLFRRRPAGTHPD